MGKALTEKIRRSAFFMALSSVLESSTDLLALAPVLDADWRSFSVNTAAYR
jgi:hypothetical protein